MSVVPTHRLHDVCETLEEPNDAAADADRDRPVPVRTTSPRVTSPGTASFDAVVPSRAPEAWLVDAAASGEDWELVVVLRGKVQYRGSWRVRLPDGHYRVFSPDTVIAATPRAKRGAPRPRLMRESDDRD